MSLSVSIRKKLEGFLLDVNLEAGEEALALLGASGCGKSMTLKCIAGILTPDEGRIVLNGRVLFDSARKINLAPRQRRVGYLFQNYALFPNMTVLQNIASGIHKPKEERQSLAEEKIKAFYLSGLEGNYPFQLSGGQQQRVALARILASEPELLLLDEPFSALDSYLKWQLELELKTALETYGVPAVFVSHNRDEVYRLCDRVSILDHGKSEPVTAVRALFDRPETLSACLLTGCKNFSRAKRLDEGHLEALDWGVRLSCGFPIPEEIRFIGARAHHLRFVRERGENVIPCRVLRVTEDVFSTIVMLQTPGPEGDFSRLRIEMPKADWSALEGAETLLVEARPDKILLLR